MKKNKINNFLRIFIILIIALFIFTQMIGCKSDGDTEEDKDDKVTTKDEMADLPSWFLNPPIEDDAIYATGYAKSSSMQHAIDKATDWARQEIARVVRIQISTMTKQFLEEAGVDNETQLTEYSSAVSKSIAKESISGSKTIERHLKSLDSKTFAVYVLVKISLKDMSGIIKDVLKANANEYAKLRANKGFEELNEELEKLNSDDYEKPNKPDYE